MFRSGKCRYGLLWSKSGMMGTGSSVLEGGFVKLFWVGICGKAKMHYAYCSPFGWTVWNETEWLLSLKYTGLSLIEIIKFRDLRLMDLYQKVWTF